MISRVGAYAADFTAKLKPHEQLQHIEQTVTENKEQAKQLAQKTADQNKALKQLHQQLVNANDLYERKQLEQKFLQDKQDALAADIAAKQRDLREGKSQLDHVMMGYVETLREPSTSFPSKNDSAFDYLHQVALLSAILPDMHDRTDNLGSDLTELREMKAQLARQQRLTVAAGVNLSEQRQKLDQLIQMRQGILKKSEDQKAEIQKQLVALSGEAADLRQLLQKVSPKKGSGPVTQFGAPSRLHWPVVGQQVRHFGDKDSDGVKSEGIAFAALSGAPVVAPAAGRVVFAGNFKGYGPIVILQHDGGYHSFLAGFGRIDAEMGEEVALGEPLGVMPVKSGEKPELYFEWRRNDEPMDPMRVGGR